MNAIAKLVGIVGLFVVAESGYAEFGVSFSVPVIDMKFGGGVVHAQDSFLELAPDEFKYDLPGGGIKVVKKAEVERTLAQMEYDRMLGAGTRAKITQAQVEESSWYNDHPVGAPIVTGTAIVAGIYGLVEIVKASGDKNTVGGDFTQANDNDATQVDQNPGDEDNHSDAGGGSTGGVSGHLKSFHKAESTNRRK